MKIIILGAGQVGATVAEALASEANDITVVDQDRERAGRSWPTGSTCARWSATPPIRRCCARPASRMPTCWSP